MRVFGIMMSDNKIKEDDFELNEKIKIEIEEARKRIREGKFITHEEVKKKFGL